MTARIGLIGRLVAQRFRRGTKSPDATGTIWQAECLEFFCGAHRAGSISSVWSNSSHQVTIFRCLDEEGIEPVEMNLLTAFRCTLPNWVHGPLIRSPSRLGAKRTFSFWDLLVWARHAKRIAISTSPTTHEATHLARLERQSRRMRRGRRNDRRRGALFAIDVRNLLKSFEIVRLSANFLALFVYLIYRAYCFSFIGIRTLWAGLMKVGRLRGAALPVHTQTASMSSVVPSCQK